MELGAFGVWATAHALGEDELGRAAALVERLGYGTFWLGGSPRLPQVRPLLEATERLTVGTGIVNVWTYGPAALAAEYAALERDFPGRLLVGIGIGHPEATSEYRRPLAAMQEFLDGLDAAAEPLPAGRRCLAALAPRMLALAGERSRGARAGPAARAGGRGRRHGRRGGSPRGRARLRRSVPPAPELRRQPAPPRLRRGGRRGRRLAAAARRRRAAGLGSRRRAGDPRASRGGRRSRRRQALGEPRVPERGWTELARELIG